MGYWETNPTLTIGSPVIHQSVPSRPERALADKLPKKPAPAAPPDSLVTASVAAHAGGEEVRVVSSKDLEGVIAELKDAYDAGLITAAEFTAAKAHAEAVSESNKASSFQVRG